MRPVRIIGWRKALIEYRNVPKGFHVEIWSRRTAGGDIEVWTSEYLSRNSWTVNHDKEEIRVDEVFRELQIDRDMWISGRKTECDSFLLKKAILSAHGEVWQ